MSAKRYGGPVAELRVWLASNLIALAIKVHPEGAWDFIVSIAALARRNDP